MFRNRKKETGTGLRVFVMALCMVMGIMIWYGTGVESFALGSAKVVAGSGKIREKASTGSEVLASVKEGDSLDVIAQTSDSDGYTWYKVYVNSKQEGYIRADLVTVSGTIPAESSGSSNSTATTSDSNGNKTVVGSNNSTTTEKKEDNSSDTDDVAVVTVNETDVTTAKVTDTVRVRKGAGTNFDVAASANADTVVTVSGQASDSDGKIWYQISYNEDNKTINGFIREDFLEVVERVEEETAVEGETAAEEENVAENNDYHLKYMTNETGVTDWYLFDNVNGTSQSLTQLLEAVEQIEANEQEEGQQSTTMRLIIIVMAVVIVIMVVAITVLIFKLRDAYEEYEDDDEYEDEEDDDDDVEEDEEEDEEEEEEEETRPRFGRFNLSRKKEQVKNVEEEEDEIEELPKTVKPSKEENKSWQSKDFLELDDDMEFEFLDL